MQGRAAVSVQWGAWAGGGMAAKAGLERMERLGYGAIAPAAGMAALCALLGSAGGASTVPQLMGSVFQWAR